MEVGVLPFASRFTSREGAAEQLKSLNRSFRDTARLPARRQAPPSRSHLLITSNSLAAPASSSPRLRRLGEDVNPSRNILRLW